MRNRKNLVLILVLSREFFYQMFRFVIHIGDNCGFYVKNWRKTEPLFISRRKRKFRFQTLNIIRKLLPVNDKWSQQTVTTCTLYRLQSMDSALLMIRGASRRLPASNSSHYLWGINWLLTNDMECSSSHWWRSVPALVAQYRHWWRSNRDWWRSV